VGLSGCHGPCGCEWTTNGSLGACRDSVEWNERLPDLRPLYHGCSHAVPMGPDHPLADIGRYSDSGHEKEKGNKLRKDSTKRKMRQGSSVMRAALLFLCSMPPGYTFSNCIDFCPA